MRTDAPTGILGIVECNVSPLFHGSGIGKLVAATGIVVNPGYTCRHLDLGVGNPAESTSINRLNAVFNDNFFDLLQIGRPRRVVIVLSQASRASAPIKPQGITLKRPANICSPGTADFAADCTPVAGIWLVVCRRDDGILQRDFGSCGTVLIQLSAFLAFPMFQNTCILACRFLGLHPHQLALVAVLTNDCGSRQRGIIASYGDCAPLCFRTGKTQGFQCGTAGKSTGTDGGYPAGELCGA